MVDRVALDHPRARRLRLKTRLPVHVGGQAKGGLKRKSTGGGATIAGTRSNCSELRPKIGDQGSEMSCALGWFVGDDAD